MSTEVAQVLRDAAAKLEKDGWCQGAYFADGRSCALGAISRVTGSGLAFNAISALRPWVPFGDVVRWNDTRDRTPAEVVKLFLTVADAEEFR